MASIGEPSMNAILRDTGCSIARSFPTTKFMELDRSRFADVLKMPDPEKRGVAYLSFIENQIRHDSWIVFTADVFDLPENARRIYLAMCFDIGVQGDGFDTTFDFYAAGHGLAPSSEPVDEIIGGFRLLGLDEAASIVSRAFLYWSDPNSPMHLAEIPWRAMDDDLGDVHGQYFKLADGLDVIVGEKVRELGEEGLFDGARAGPS